VLSTIYCSRAVLDVAERSNHSLQLRINGSAEEPISLEVIGEHGGLLESNYTLLEPSLYE
jgi:hypothetical protein